METIKKLLVMVAGILAFSAFSQPPIGNPAEKMKALSMLEGNWTGGGWLLDESRQRVEFTQNEEIRFELNKTILRIKGQGYNPEGKQIHDALGIIFYDNKENKYFMDAFLATGQHTLAEITLTEKGLDWSIDTGQGGSVKYIITIEKDTWVEKGYFSPDGLAQYPFMEFTLTRK